MHTIFNRYFIFLSKHEWWFSHEWSHAFIQNFIVTWFFPGKINNLFSDEVVFTYGIETYKKKNNLFVNFSQKVDFTLITHSEVVANKIWNFFRLRYRFSTHFQRMKLKRRSFFRVFHIIFRILRIKFRENE